MAKGDGFAVCTMKKQSGGGGGLSAHIDREVYSPELDRMVPFRPASVRDDSRTALNRECIESTVKIGRTQAIWKRLSEAGFSRKKDDKQDDSKKTRKIKDSAVIALCFVCTSDEETMKKLEAEGKLDDWIKRTIAWFQKEFGKENVVSAVLHMDETSPHLHITVVPITTKEAKERKEKPKFDENGKPIKKYETDKEGNIVLDEKGRAVVKKRSYKKQEVTARLSAKDICNPVAMDRWQTDYAEAMKVFGMKRGVKGSKQKNVPAAEWQLQQINGQLVAVEKEVQEQEATKKANATTIENQEATISDNKATIEQQESSISSNTSAIQEQGDTITTNNSIIEKQSATIEEQQSTISGNKTELEKQNAELDRMAKGSLYDKLRHANLSPDVRRAFEEKDEEVRNKMLATNPDGSPLTWKGGNKDGVQLTWEEYAKWLKEQERLKAEKALQEKKDAVEKAKADAKAEHDAEIEEMKETYKQIIEREKLAFSKNGKPIMWQGNYKKGQQVTKDERIEFLEEENENFKKAYKDLVERLKPVKDLVFALLSLNFRKVVQIILDQWKAGLKEFTKDLKDFLLEAMSVEKTVEDRKLYVDDAFKGAKAIARTDVSWKSKEEDLKPLYDDAIRIADGTWESYHSNNKLKEAAVRAVASLANTPNRKYWSEDDIRAVNAYLNTVPDGSHNAAINELKESALFDYEIRQKAWLDDVINRIKQNSLGDGQGLGY